MLDRVSSPLTHLRVVIVPLAVQLNSALAPSSTVSEVGLTEELGATKQQQINKLQLAVLNKKTDDMAFVISKLLVIINRLLAYKSYLEKLAPLSHFY